MHGKMQASGRIEFIPFLCTSALWANPVSMFSFLLALPQLLSNHPGKWRNLLDWFMSLCKYLYSSSIYRSAQFFQNNCYFDYLAVLGFNHACGNFDLPCAPEGSFICGIWTLSYRIWDLVPWPVIQPRPPALGAWSCTHWTTREVPG